MDPALRHACLKIMLCVLVRQDLGPDLSSDDIGFVAQSLIDDRRIEDANLRKALELCGARPTRGAMEKYLGGRHDYA